MSEASTLERVINVVDIEPQYRHAILFRLVEHLAPGTSLQIIVHHDPKRLRMQLAYLEQGPDIWRVRLLLLSQRDGDHG
ncbi:DUF2249 domain-containing protein [Bradyrhizobium sp. BR13661]|uniref:DUF2249 domain-containing protein n=1 Tax=Bradyrhizobium sp. BR13661 TaxID=2940622 RepID=UPI002472FE26|nr:DUF2249 domain-containing protein [Bradyrhizobium sp. BR13661]